MKMNVQRISHPLLKQPGLMAVSYETERSFNSVINSIIRDFNITIYKDENIITWAMLCPCDKNIDSVELKQRFLKEDEECTQIEEGILDFAVNWARSNNFSKMYVQACDASIPYYQLHGFKEEGKAVCIDGNLLQKMVKAL